MKNQIFALRTLNSDQARPTSIYVVSLWSIARGLLAVLGLYGEYVFLEDALQYWVGNNPSLFELWSLAPVTIKFGILFLFIQVFVFFVMAIGIFRGHNWGRLGFIIVSTAVLIWKTWGAISYLIAIGDFIHLHQILHSLLAVCIALWYFDQRHILQYFGIERRLLNWTF